jgi:putative membrane protein
MGEIYNIVKGLHILAIIAWMAGLLYLPRLFVYHTRAKLGSEMDETFKTMEAKLMGLIMTPSMIVAWILGLTLIGIDSQGLAPTVFGSVLAFLAKPWMAVKFIAVLAQTAWHGYLWAARKRFAAGENLKSERYWRMVNEVPFVLAAVIVLSVTTKFGG